MHPPSAEAQLSMNPDLHRSTSTLLQGRRLLFFRLGWMVLTILALIVFIASVSEYVTSEQKPSVTGYTVFFVALGMLVALVWFSVAGLIFWHKSDDWMALLVALMLVLQGASTTINPLNVIPSFWQVLVQI